ncbi:MAG: hypothetical protein AAGD14_04645 [Planctomycetota bacterium]
MSFAEKSNGIQVALTGATGMVGGEALRACLASDRVARVVSFGRRPVDIDHPKLRQVGLEDFDALAGTDVALYCIGVYTGQVSDEELRRITIDMPVAFAEALARVRPDAAFCLLSGMGADRTEKSRFAFARYKGIAENRLADIGLARFHSLRPGYIHPTTPRASMTASYRVMSALWPIVRRILPNAGIESADLAAGMLRVGLEGEAKNQVLENKEIRQWACSPSS